MYFNQFLLKSDIFAPNFGFIKIEKSEFESPDREENTSETSSIQANAKLLKFSGIVDNIFERNLCSELTEPSQNCNEIDVSQTPMKQNFSKISRAK